MTGVAAMAQLIARCPLTGHYLFMGIEIDDDNLRCLPETFARKFCPFCACEHAWYKKDAKLQQPRPQFRRGLQQAS
jgi:hypothetical protein